MSMPLMIKVRDRNQAFHASFRGKRASATSSREAAAEAVARKVMGEWPFRLLPRGFFFNGEEYIFLVVGDR